MGNNQCKRGSFLWSIRKAENMKRIIDFLQELRPEFDFMASEDYIEEGMLDSFDVVSLVSMMDKEYGISIKGREIVPENF